MPTLPEHPHIDTILLYYRGCNEPDADLMASTFTEDVVHYYVDHEPVRGREGLAGYWAKVGPRTQAHWTVDHAMVCGDEAVIEWAMRWTPPGLGEQELLRGSEWFVFRGGLIAEVRSYHNNYHLRDPANFELRGFPYDQRGYS
jgi:hypothetical protein